MEGRQDGEQKQHIRTNSHKHTLLHAHIPTHTHKCTVKHGGTEAGRHARREKEHTDQQEWGFYNPKMKVHMHILADI